MFAKHSSKNTERQLTEMFEETLFEDIAAAIKGEMDISLDRLRTILSADDRDESISSNVLSAVTRIEYDLRKTNPHLVCRTVLVAIDQGGTATLRKVSRDYPWEDLPRQVRSKFIMEQKNSFTYLLYPIHGKEVDDVTDR